MAWRRLGLVALAALLLGGTLELHPADEAAGLLDSQIYFPGASHPEQPAHVETSPALERPHCAACLSRLQSWATGLPAPLRQDTPLALERLPGTVSAPPLQAARPGVRGRAPPLS